jgi:hypothetical protein
MIRRMSVMAFLLAVVISATPAFGGDDEVYMYDQGVETEVDVGRFTQKGDVAFTKAVSRYCDGMIGPAPDPYPSVQLWEPDYEILGASGAEIDGLWFINWGRHWVKNRLGLVLWKIRIPNANQRMASEFEQDMTLSLWVDWDENEMWDKRELEIRSHFNIGHCFPTDEESLTIYYLTCFRVPDVTEMATSQWWWNGGNWKKEIRNYWVRGTLAYDDPDVSPDGEQLFGEVEDYRVSYMLITRRPKHGGDDDDDD